MFDFDGAVLVPIDVQKALDWPGAPRRGNPRFDANGQALLARFRAAGRPIVHVRHDSVEPGSRFAPDHPGNALRDGFEPLAGEGLVTKSVNSAFVGTDLDLRLRRLGARRLVMFGWASDMCVSTTIRHGVNLGWEVICVPDACDCSDLPDPFGAGVIPAEEVHRIHMATLAAEFCRLVRVVDCS